MPDTKYIDANAFTAFVNEMIAQKGQELSGGEKSKLKFALTQGLNDAVESAVLEAMSDEQLAQLDALMENNASEKEVDAFFDNIGVDFTEVAKGALEEYKQKYLAEGNNDELIKQAEETTAAYLQAASVEPGREPAAPVAEPAAPVAEPAVAIAEPVAAAPVENIVSVTTEEVA